MNIYENYKASEKLPLQRAHLLIEMYLFSAFRGAVIRFFVIHSFLIGLLFQVFCLIWFNIYFWFPMNIRKVWGIRFAVIDLIYI